MAKQDYTLPHQDLNDLVPKELRNPVLGSLFDNLFNRFLTKDEAIPLYGYVGRKPTAPDDRTPKIPQPSVERDVNALVPVLSFKAGTKTYSFTPQDLIRKTEVLGVQTDQSQWLWSQGNNYVPPIDLDKFTNFFNYFWVAKALPTAPNISWNPTNAPEFYVIERPKENELDKLNVRLATSAMNQNMVLTGTGFDAQTWTVTFTSPTEFTVSCELLPGILPSEQVQTFSLPVPADAANPYPGPWGTDTYTVSFHASGSPTGSLLTFNIVRDMVLDGDGNPLGYESFAAGDTFTITAPFLSSSYNVTFTGTSGTKGKLTNVNSLDVYQSIDGVQVSEGDRVLIKDQGNPGQNGIYIVKPGAWVRASDFDGANMVVNAKVFVREGTANAKSTWLSTPTPWTWALTAANSISNTNDWQEHNYWVHGNDLATLGYDISKVVQATRPIIEFKNTLPLNSYFSDGLPSDGGTLYEQKKSEFNQAPLFDLYKYDGTHSGKVSPLFFYVQDPTADIDTVLQRRVKHSTNVSSDFVFDHGMTLDGRTHLFYKDKSGALHTIWHAGYSAPTIVDQIYGGTGNGTLSVQPSSNPFSSQQIWTLTAISPTVFEVSGSKNKVVPTSENITVNVPYDNGLFACIITSGSTPFQPGDTFVFRLGNLETTRYVYRDTNQELYDLWGGQAADLDESGAWQIPRTFYNNVPADSSGEVPEGTLYSHFRGILANQIGENIDYAFGGSIKLWSEQQNLLASLLMQRDVTPISMIEFAQKQYETALNSVRDIFISTFMQYLAEEGTAINVSTLTAKILAVRAKDNDVRQVLYDSTSAITGFPITLPMLGVTPRELPGFVFDQVLGATLIKHHDGHLSAPAVFNQQFMDAFIGSNLTIKRSDGSSTPAVGSRTATPPANPYKGEIWLYPTTSGFEFRVFNVLGDTNVAPTATAAGQHWYNRNTGTLYTWTGAQWAAETSLSAAWSPIDPASMLNQVILSIEKTLYDSCNPEHRTFFTASDLSTVQSSRFSAALKEELSIWGAANGYDPYAPDYVSTDAFTWNYSSATNFAAVNTPSVPARWHNALLAHQASIPGVIGTVRPNLEPWKLLGFSTKPANFDAQYRSTYTPDDLGSLTFGANVRVVKKSSVPVNSTLSGLPNIDGVQLHAGDLVLLVSEATPANNGVWAVFAGGWQRPLIGFSLHKYFNVTEGTQYAGTQFVIVTAPNTLNFDPMVLEQIREWKQELWTDILSAHPTLKLSVDPNRDILLPPYVSPSLPWSAYALTNVIPPNPAKSYAFGEGSPVQSVWERSIEYRYSLAKALFKQSPLEFLGFCWGFEWVQVDGILYDGFDIAMPGHKSFRLHGEMIDPIARTSPIISLSGPAAIQCRIIHDGYTTDHKQSFTVTVNGIIIGRVKEGVQSTVTNAGYTVTVLIEDNGDPFRVGDEFAVTANSNGSGMVVTFYASPYLQILGFGQIFTHALRASSIETTQGYAMQAFRGWDINLGYRAGGLVSTDDLRVFNDSEALPESAYELRFKKSPYAKDLWLQGLRITTTVVGTAVQTKNGSYTPVNDASDWVFRVQGYNSRHLGISFYVMNEAGPFQTFKALSSAHTDREWKRYTEAQSVLNTELPLTITGLQNVLNFLTGYALYLEHQGWKFDDAAGQNIDQVTGRVRNFELEIEKFVDAVYAGVKPGEGASINPFIDRVWLTQDEGLLAEFTETGLFDIHANPAVFDTLGVKIPVNSMNVLRGKEYSEIGANTPMYSVHAQIDEYEHLFVFNKYTSPSTSEGLIFDPFSGARISTIKLNGRRQASQTLRPEFGGHFMVGDEVKRNIQASVDKISTYYDTDHVFEDEISTRHALALLGFSPKTYMSNLDLNDRSQFNFWRGLVQMKGTNSSIDAFLNNDRFQDAKLDEYWAYKVAEYGDSRSKAFPELRVTVDDTLQQFTKYIFDPTAVPVGFNTFIQIDSDDESRWFSIDDLNQDTYFIAMNVGTVTKTVNAGDVIELPFIADGLSFDSSSLTQVNSTTLVADVGGTFTITGHGPSTPKFNPVKLFNYVDAELVQEIPLWHPAYGQHTPAALSSINIISSQDPARYNVSTLVTGNANYDPLRMWGSREVGRVWWDTTNLAYVPYYDYMIYGTVDERLNRWGKLADYASVDVVEWVESSVPPSEYDLQALQDAGNADLDPYTKADGTVYGAKTYSRPREWKIRPIAWSKAGTAVSAAHPSFNASYSSNLYFLADGYAVLETGNFADYGITANMRLGAWQQDANSIRPLSEYLVTGEFTKITYVNDLRSTSVTPVAYTGFSGSVELEISSHTDKVGALAFTSSVSTSTALYNDQAVAVAWDVSSYLRCVEVNSSEEQIVLVRVDRGTGAGVYYGATFDVSVNDLFTFDFSDFGLRIKVRSTVQGTFSTEVLAKFLSQTLVNISMKDAARIELVVPLSDPEGLVADQTLFVNDSTDPLYSINNGVGWRAWEVPTQAMLKADSRVPDSIWFPYVGEAIAIAPSAALVAEATSSSAGNFTLNNGTVIQRYKSDWGSWTELKQITKSSTRLSGTGPVTFTVPAQTTIDQISVYVNGVQQLAGTYTLSSNVLTVTSVSRGHKVYVLIRPYSPTAKELAFDPAVADDLTFQTQYKRDYQYVEIPVRDTDGTLSTTKYYFWVKNRSTAARKKDLSIKAVTELLVNGPSQYLTFQNLMGSDTSTDGGTVSSSWFYNAITIAGLNYVVTKDDTFKLRFTRNFTLRDDPNELDLKDTHTEWALIRPGQRSKIPEALWQKLVDTACAQDAAGNTLPSPRRVSYDERNGTRTRYGFGADQVLAPSELVTSTILFTILNTKLVDDSGAVLVPDYMTFLNFDESDSWFSTAESTRNILTRVWNEGKASQINEIFFAVLEDICAANYELTDLFKTSRLSAYSIKVVSSVPAVPTYE